MSAAGGYTASKGNQMQRTRFMALAGHLDDYPLSDLIGTLRRQRKTGRLLIEYPTNPGVFYFKDGNLVDAQLNKLSGLQAVCAALSQPSASFNFNPVIQPPRHSIDNSLQKFILELLGCWEAEVLDVEATAKGDQSSLASPPARPGLSVLSKEELAELKDMLAAELKDMVLAELKDMLALPSPARLALPPSNRATARPGRRVLMICVIAILIGLPIGVLLSQMIGKHDPPVMSSQSSVEPVAEQASSTTTGGASTAPLNASESISDATPIQHRKDQIKERGSNREGLRGERDRAASAKEDAPRPLGDVPPPAKALQSANPVKDVNNGADSNAQSVGVVMKIENGHVTQAFVANHRPGMEAYEALALRIARQRRYPTKAEGQETVLIKVNPPK